MCRECARITQPLTKCKADKRINKCLLTVVTSVNKDEHLQTIRVVRMLYYTAEMICKGEMKFKLHMFTGS